MSEASVVDFPEPVGPVTSTSPRGFSASVGHHLGQRQRLERDDVERDQAEGGADGGALEVGVDAEAGATGDLVGEVELPVVLELLALRVGEDRVDDLARVRRRQRRIAVDRRQATADAHHRRRPCGDVQVGGAAVDDLQQYFGEIEIHP